MKRPVFGIDIDGTLGDYHPHFLRFAEGWVGVHNWPGSKAARAELAREGRSRDVRAFSSGDYYGECSLAEFMGVSKATYRQCKLAYRMGGLKRSMPALPWASDLTHTLRSWGADVFICTSRPYLSHDNIDSDTRHWLRRNRIACQGVIWGEHKYRELARTVGKERVVAVLDDLPEMCEQAASLGIHPVLALRPHNWHHATGFDVAASHEETLLALKVRLEIWRQGSEH